MANCFDLTDDVTAINKSYVCLDRLLLDKNANESDYSCYPTYEQQYNRSSWYCGYIEAAIYIVLGLATFPANAIAIHNYRKRQVTAEFVLLITSVAASNCLTGLVAMNRGFARVLMDFPFGKIGCSMTATLACFALTCSMQIQMLISFERKMSVTFQQHRSSRRILMPVLLFADVVVMALAWGYMSVYQGILHYEEMYIDGVRNGTALVGVCFMLGFRIRIDGVLAFFLIFTFILPFGFTFYNYISIWRFLRRWHRTSAMAPNERSYLMAHNRLLRHQHSREEFLARLMVFSLLQFLICIMPVQVAVSYLVVDSFIAKNYKAQSFQLYASYLFVIIESIINPLWSSFVRWKPD